MRSLPRPVADFRAPGHRWRARAATALTTVLLALSVGGAPAASAADAPVTGAGTVSGLAQLDSWTLAARARGVTVDYQPMSSADGRNLFRGRTTDFAVTDLPYGLVDHGVADPPPDRPFGYLPLTAEGVAFPYNLLVQGRPVTGLRLSAATLAGMFSRTITSWDDPAVQADNPGLPLPRVPVRPVVRSSPSATTLELTRWLATEQPAAWETHCRITGTTPCGPTTVFPPVGNTAALGSDLAIVNHVHTAGNNGAIGYTTSAYTVVAGTPTARILNHAGYYTAPTPAAVAIGLSAARAAPDGFTDLSGVPGSGEPRAYPLAVVNHLVAPTALTPAFSAEQGHALGVWAGHGLCAQAGAAALADAPLPPSLIASGLRSLAAIPGAEPVADPAGCTDPIARLIDDAPAPLPCDRVGPPGCTTDLPGPGATQLVTATVQPGGLVVSVTGSTAVVLPQPTLTPDGIRFQTAGRLGEITVTDTRAGRLPWTLSGQAGDFTGPGGAVIPARNLGWTPYTTAVSGAVAAVPGPAVPSSIVGSRTGLGVARELALGIGPGTDRAGAALDLRFATSTPPGSYTSLLTLTAI